MTDDLRAKEIIQPILDLFTGADGGVAFAILRHDLLPYALSKPDLYAEYINSFENVSKICKNILKEYCNE